MSDRVIETLDPDEPEVRALIAASDRFYLDLYPPESNHLESGAELKSANAIFIGCRVDGTLVASGAAKLMHDDGDYAEIKRVYVVETHRGQGLSLAIMHDLEDRLRARGCSTCRLETGIKQPEALGLYRRLGYVERGPYGAYREDPLSVFMEKCLAEGEG